MFYDNSINQLSASLPIELPVKNGDSKKMVFKTNYCLMLVKNIYFRPSLRSGTRRKAGPGSLFLTLHFNIQETLCRTATQKIDKIKTVFKSYLQTTLGKKEFNTLSYLSLQSLSLVFYK